MLNSANYTINIFTPVVLIIFFFSTVIFALSVSRSKDSRFRYFSYHMFFSWVYVAAYLMQSISVPLEQMLFWANIKVTSVCYSPITWVNVSTLVTINRRPPKWINVVLLVIAAANTVVIWMDGSLHIFRESVSLVSVSDNLYMLRPVFGVWFKSVFLWSLYIPVAATVLLYVLAYMRAGKRLKTTYLMMLAIIVVSLVSALPLSMMITVVDTRALTIIFVHIMYYIIIFRFNLMEVIPTARDIALDIVKAGVFIFNSSKVLIDYNKYAKEYSQQDFGDLSLDTLCEYYGVDISDEDVYEKNITCVKEYEDCTEWYNVYISSINRETSISEGFLVLVNNITAQHRVMAIESEKFNLEQKKIIINDIHDGVCGSLTVLSMLAEKSAMENENPQEILKSIKELSQETLKEVRLLMSSYDKENVNLWELSGDLRYIGNLFTEGSGIIFEHRVSISPYENKLVPFNIYLNIVRFYKETVVNSIKHSEGDKISSYLEYNGSLISISVSDNGKGIGSDVSYGRGLKSISIRLNDIGGKIQTINGGGAKFLATIPME